MSGTAGGATGPDGVRWRSLKTFTTSLMPPLNALPIAPVGAPAEHGSHRTNDADRNDNVLE